jgi:hypothetical protein
MKPVLKIITHLGAAALGVALAATALPRFSRSQTVGEKPDTRRQPTVGSENPREKTVKPSSRTTTGQSRSAAFRSAWSALAKEPLNTEDRVAAQSQLLAEWAKVDLDGALQAFLGEAWDGTSSDPFAYNGGLPTAFATEFREHPESSWAALSRNKMARALLAGTWIENAATKDPELTLSILDEIPLNLRFDAMNRIFDRENPLSPETRAALLTKLASIGSPDEVERRLAEIYRRTPATGDPAVLAAQWNALPTGPQRTVQMTAWANTMRGLDLEKFSSEWAKIPAADQAQAARLLLAQVDNSSPALTFAIDRAILTEQWDIFKEDIANKLRGFKTDRQALARWALTLPERQETRAVFNLAISEKLLENPAAGQAWLEQLPAGSWHREWGLVEMTLGRLWARGDIEGANLAIERITDPRAREEALKCRYDWQLITSQPHIVREK